MARREAGETSSGIAEDPELVARITSVMDAKENVKPPPRPKIQKVISLLRDREDYRKYYEPRVVSFGPIHHGGEKYKLAEKYKLVMTNEFVEGSAQKINDLYEKVVENITELRACFEEEVNKKFKDDKALAWLLLVDGCAILQHIYCATSDKKKFEELNIKPDSVTFTQQDLFLLENQLPYCLLKWLMSWSGSQQKESKLKESIKEYINRHVTVPQPEDPSLILSCAWLSWISWNWLQPSEKKESRQSSNIGSASPRPQEETELLESDHVSIQMDGNEDPIHLLDLLRTQLLGKHQQNISKNSNGEMETWQSYRNVQELRAAGIHVERSKKKNSCLSDISFTTLGFLGLGYLWLPPLVVNDSTRPKFLNLIAYETCLDFKNDFGVTSYISFLDSLIDEPNDVKMLRKARILHNCLGSDEEVAKLFNEISIDSVPNNEIYSDVRSKIQKHYRNKWMTWIAQFFHDHFSSPWTFIAFVGALLALVLTVIQTKYAVNPSPGPCDSVCKNFTRT